MWKSVVWITLLLGYSYAGIASWSEDISVHNNAAVTGIHYSQHESSVNAARKAAAERLQQPAALVASGGTTGPCDKLCYNRYIADGASDVETVGQGIVGFTSTGTAAGAVGSSQKYSSTSSRMSESSVQNVHGAVVYPAVASTSGVRSSYSSSSSSRHSSGSAQPAAAALYSADHERTQAHLAQPLVYTVSAPKTHASQSSYERSSNERTVVSRPVVANVVYTSVPAGGSSSNSFNARSSFSAASNEQQLVQPVTYPTANSDYSGRYIAQQDHQYRQYPSKTYVMYSKPITSSVQYYAPSRSRTEESASSTSYDSSGRVVNLNVVQPVHSERVDEQRTQQRAESVQTVQRQSDLYPVRSSFDFQEKVNQEQDYEDIVDGASSERPQRVIAPTVPSSSSSSSQRRAEQQSTYVRTGSYVPNIGSSTRYSTAQAADSQRRQTYQSSPTYVAAVPVVGAGSTSKYESASESQHQQQRHSQNSLNVPLVVQPAPAGSASSSSSRYASSQQEHRASAGGPGYYAPAGASSYGSQYATDTAAHSSVHNNRYKAGSGGSFIHFPITHDEFGRRFGAVGGAGGYGADTDLRDIMSESESLARMQAQNVHNGAVSGSGTFDADTRFGGESEGLGTMPGGFQRSKSWSSSSKWASEQRYGEDGKPKTSSMLSTAESEKHNVNGKTTGYKAATTTVEDDGKVSTYSLHTT
ncbi:protein lingerer [Anopheles marshallii]|uniref:protein lingerer n=1 Tax=Anopheles marshallii TaxID=1521116 RepID=UPI00237B6346|nr:protein lingerer [Anopheles marshallii]